MQEAGDFGGGPEIKGALDMAVWVGEQGAVGVERGEEASVWATHIAQDEIEVSRALSTETGSLEIW